jgi:hypothetical protein
VKVIGKTQTWTVKVDLEPGEYPDLQISATLWVTPQRVILTYRRDKAARRWQFDTLVARGPIYQLLKSGTHKPHGSGPYTSSGGRAPEEYHKLILDEGNAAEIEYRR